MKLNLFLARAGVASRRKSAELVKAGRVTVNGAVVPEPFREVSAGDKVSVDGKGVRREKLVHIALNKPVGVTCTLKDRFAKKKVTDLVPKSLGRLYPVGRLDRDSSGLVILTNDGDFGQRMSHPRYQVEKEYLVSVSPPVSNRETAAMRAGISCDDEVLTASEVGISRREPERSLLRIVLKEGRKREIRRMLGSLGHRVETLQRVRMGGILLGDLKPGAWRYLTEEEVKA